jgi:C1A family cysteine protease
MKNLVLYSANIIFLILLLQISNTKSDLPVHCLVSDIQGEWVIRVNKETFDAQINDQKTSCKHGFPSEIDKTVGDHDFSWSDYREIILNLNEDYTLTEGGVQVGNWTPIYDQSFVIFYNNSLLTAPYMYFKDNRGEYKSNCKKSMIGWYTPDKDERTKNWSCFFAFKKNANTRSFLQMTTTETSNSQAEMQKIENLHNSLKYENLQNVVEEINGANLLWKAKVHSDFEGMSFTQLKSHLGMRNRKTSLNDPFKLKKNDNNFIQVDKAESLADLQEFFNKVDIELEKATSHKEQSFSEMEKTQSESVREQPHEEVDDPSGREKDSYFVKDHNEVIKYMNKPHEEIPEDKIAKNWDWRNVGGINYVPELRSQGGCGSCYVFATMNSLGSRLRIQTNNQDKTVFSPQFPISCNFYSEGCEGGYPFLVGKFFHEFEVVPESCFPYIQSDSKCSNVCDYTKNPKKYRVSKYGYLGGYYGATNEILMMKEIRANGPMPGNIRVPYTFNYYSNGIYSEKDLKKNSDKLSKTTLVDKHLSWEKVEHSVTLVGYGEENGVKYWIGMNTWGRTFGEEGFFRILRGENECSIESMGDYLQLEVVDR